MQYPAWVVFDPVDATVVIDMVRSVAAAADPGEHGDGVEVVIETPRPGRLAGLFGADEPAQARIVVTKAGGTVAYPFDVRLVTEHDGAAARMVGARPGWAVSNSAGLAFLVQKGRDGQRFDWGGLVGGAVAALSALRPRAPRRSWRARVDRGIHRALTGEMSESPRVSAVMRISGRRGVRRGREPGWGGTAPPAARSRPR